MRGIVGVAGLVALCFWSSDGRAADPFELNLNIDGRPDRRTYTSAEDAIDALDGGGLRQINPDYTDVSAATADILFRGIPIRASFAAGSSALQFQLDALRINRTFSGATRDDSVELLRRYFEGRDGADELTRILRYGVRTTAADPIAGNPASATNRMVAHDFDRALSGGVGSTGASIGVRFGSFSGAGHNTRTLDLPLGLSWQLSDDDVLEVDAPLSMADTEGAMSYGANIGIRWRRRVTPDWILQPSVRVGGAGSVDLAGGSGLYSVALNSTYTYRINDDWRLTLANGVTYVSTFPVSVGDYRLDYDLKNVVFRNGLAVSYDTGIRLAGLATTVSAFIVDTRFTGDAVFVRNYQEFGVYGTFGTQAPIRVGITGLVGERGVRGFYVNTGMSF